MYTISGHYFGTGEGSTYMVLYTRGYGPNGTKSVENAIQEFRNKFGHFVETNVAEGISFGFPGAKLLVSEPMRQALVEWNSDGTCSYHASCHSNFS